MDPFQEPAREPIISVEKMQEYVGDVGKVAAAIEALFGSDGWHLFLARFEQRRREIEAKDDYATIDDFHADRRALKLVDELFNELTTYRDDAQRATDLLKSLTAEDQNPRSTVALSTGGAEG